MMIKKLNKSKILVLFFFCSFSNAFHNCRENETLVTQSFHIYPSVLNEWKAPLLFDTLSTHPYLLNSLTFTPPASVCLV